MAENFEIQKYQKELFQVKELFKQDVKMAESLTDDNILRIIHLLEKWRQENDLNGFLEYWRVEKKNSYWIAYSLLTEEETKSLHAYQYRNIVQNFIDTKVLKAKKSGQLKACRESIRKHRVHENKIFIDLINSSTELTEEEKSEILNSGKLLAAKKEDDQQILSDVVEDYNDKELQTELAALFNIGGFDVYFTGWEDENVREDKYNTGITMNESLEWERVILYSFEEPDPWPMDERYGICIKVSCYLLSEKELDEYINYAYESYLHDALAANSILLGKKINLIKSLLESEEKEFESLTKGIDVNS